MEEENEKSEEELIREEEARLAELEATRIEKERQEEEAILKRAAAKAEERRLEQEEFKRQKEEAEARKKRFAEAKAQRDKEEAEKKEQQRLTLLREEEKRRKRDEDNRRRKEEEERLRKLLVDKIDFRKEQCQRVAPEGTGEAVREACSSGDAEELAELAREWEGHPLLDEPDRDGRTPIMLASRSGATACVLILISLWENEYDSTANNRRAVLAKIDLADEVGMTALMFAAIANSMECIRLLVGKGAKKSIANEDGFTPVLWAAKFGNLAALRCLEELHASMAVVTKGGLTALECARVGLGKSRRSGRERQQETIAYLVELKKIADAEAADAEDKE